MEKMMHPCSNANFVDTLDITLHAGQRQKKKPIPLKFMYYLPIIPRLQRMFASMQTAQHMTWHDENKIQGMLRHSSDEQA